VGDGKLIIISMTVAVQMVVVFGRGRCAGVKIPTPTPLRLYKVVQQPSSSLHLGLSDRRVR